VRHVRILLIASLLVACGDAAPSASVGNPEGDWVLAAGTENGQDVPIPDEPPITLTIDGSSIGGTVCNSFGGRVTLSGGRLRIADLAGTAMACVDEEVMTAETLVMTALSLTESITVEDGELIMRGPGVELRYVEAGATPSG
jgi:heat shock protein HslJ